MRRARTQQFVQAGEHLVWSSRWWLACPLCQSRHARGYAHGHRTAPARHDYLHQRVVADDREVAHGDFEFPGDESQGVQRWLAGQDHGRLRHAPNRADDGERFALHPN